jgi:hypothetical protein
MATKGLLLLDVDGPLNPYAAPRFGRAGYVRYAENRAGEWSSCRGLRRPYRHHVWLHPGHGRLLLALAQQSGLRLVWATAWEHDANVRVGPVIGLDHLPVIEFPECDAARDADGRLRWRADGGWKWPAVAAYAAGRPLAWLDDEHHNGEYADARSAFHRDRAGCPTLLCHVDPRHGLRPDHVVEIRDWAAGLL